MEADTQLVERAKNGDVAAFSELVVRHQKSLLRLAYRVLGDLEMAQDVVQESFLKAFQKINTFEGRSAFKSWAFQITLNTAKNKLRGKRPELVDIDKMSLASSEDLEEGLLNGSLKEIMQVEIEKLPTKQRTALNLRIFEDLTFNEIADIMKCPYDTAKANYRHALIKLRHNLKDSLGADDWRSSDSKNTMEAEA